MSLRTTRFACVETCLARLVRRRGRLIAEATVPSTDLPPVDVAKLVDEERDRWPT